MNNYSTAKPALLEIGFFRITLGIYLLIYNLPFYFDLDKYFGPNSFLPNDFLPTSLTYAPSFFPWPTLWFTTLFTTMLILIVLFTLGQLNRITLIPLYLLQLYFYHANPLIIHEAQPLANLFLMLFFFLPPNSAPIFRPAGQYTLDDAKIKELRILLNIIITFFGLYYLIVGLKKLPDPMWRDGVALQHIMVWDGVTRNNGLALWIANQPWISKVMTYTTLLFEISFLLLVFTPLRFICIAAGLALHAGIFLTMDVGSLSLALIVWYALLFDENTRQKVSNFFQKSKKRQ